MSKTTITQTHSFAFTEAGIERTVEEYVRRKYIKRHYVSHCWSVGADPHTIEIQTTLGGGEEYTTEDDVLHVRIVAN